MCNLKTDVLVVPVLQGCTTFDHAVHIQVSSVSAAARSAIEKAGGSVSTVYYNTLGLRALLKPESFAKKGRALPRPVRALPPRLQGLWEHIGEIPPVKDVSAALTTQGGGSAAALPASPDSVRS